MFLGEIVSLKVWEFVEMVEDVNLNWSLGFHERIIALVKVVVVWFYVLFGSEAKWFAPETVSLTVRKSENIYFASDAMEAEFGHLFFNINY